MASTLTNLLYHIVFSTKHRHPILTKAIRDDLYAYIGGIVRGEGGVLLEIGGMPDHVHLVVRFRAEPSVATMLRKIKSKSSQWLNAKPKRPGRFQWQRGYGAFTVSASQLDKVRAYVRNQERHHRRPTFQDEFRELLRRHGIEFDERYIWD
jgi:REP element-mobilizing transposase RayT